MYEHADSLTPPSNPDISIWRYMDLPKLISILSTGTLWFARADTLGDPHEGAYGPLSASRRQTLFPELDAAELAELSRALEHTQRFTYVNCWHMAEFESIAMWRLYAPAGQGVAIRSTYSRLTSSLTGPEVTNGGVVCYVDPASDEIPHGSTVGPFMHKRRSFEYEREFRAVHTVYRDLPNGVDLRSLETPVGVGVPVDLSLLIDSVYVAPQQPQWFRDVIRLVVERFGPQDVRVKQSDLDADPVF